LKELAMTASGFGTVAFLGIGLMGSRQARRLLDAGHRLIVVGSPLSPPRPSPTIVDASPVGSPRAIA